MANILDYLDWRGDLTFNDAPFNEVDNYILSNIGFPDFGGIVPEDGFVPIGYAVNKLVEEGRASLGVLASISIIDVLRRLPDTPRFQTIMLGFYSNKECAQLSEQFGAMTLYLPDGTRYVSFKGTDESMHGWKEDLMMASCDTVPAQADAAEYLMKQAEYPGKMIVGGHSKGGNLAMYAALSAPPEVQDRIIAIYNNDGPGFNKDIFSEERYLRIKDKVRTIMSENAIVGLLMNYDKDCIIVKTKAIGADAHDGYLWEVLGNSFVRADNFSSGSLLIRDTVKEVLDGMPGDTQLRFTEALFDTLDKAGVKTYSDITDKTPSEVLALAKGMAGDPDVKNVVHSFADRLLKNLAEDTISGVLELGRKIGKKEKTE